jgi:hypothetical protein
MAHFRWQELTSGSLEPYCLYPVKCLVELLLIRSTKHRPVTLSQPRLSDLVEKSFPYVVSSFSSL